MTLQELFNIVGADPTYIIAYFIMVPIIALIVGFTSKGEAHLSPWNYIFSALVYLACIPGIFAATLCIYNFFFERQSFLNLNIFVYFLPILSMFVTLFLIKNRIAFNRIPGFSNLSGLIMVITATFIVMLLIQKTRIWVVFIGSVGHLLIAFLVLFLIIRIGFSKLFKQSKN